MFKFLFCLILSEMILRHTDKLSQTLQQPKMSSVEGHAMAVLTVNTLEILLTDVNFDLLWLKVEQRREKLDVDEAHLTRRRKVPKRFDQANTPTEHALSTKDEYHLVYSEAIDLAVTSIRSRFNQKGYITFSKVEQLFLHLQHLQPLSHEFMLLFMIAWCAVCTCAH